jgi:histidine ammonia-lyase
VASQHKELESPFVTLLRDDTLRAWHASQVSAMPVDATLAKTGNFDAELILARAKAERTTSATTLEGWLSQGEMLAFLHSPELVAEVARRISE